MHPNLLIASFVSVTVVYSIYWLYRYLSSPERSIPGPWMTNFTRLWFFDKIRVGSFHHENIALHEKYGPIVRVAPGFYSISQPDKAVYGFGSKFPKGDWYQGWKHPSPDRWTLFPDQDIKRHSETRKRFQGLYSMSSLLSYESYVEQCIDVFDEKLRGFSKSGETIDLAHWLQCYAFDVIGMITYSERFGFLNSGEDIAGVMGALDRSMMYSTLVGVFPKLHPYLYAILERIPKTGAAGRTYLMGFVQQKINERREAEANTKEADTVVDETAPQDFLDKITQARKQNPDKVTPYHIFMMGLSNIIAGADTTAISLASIMYHLITSPHAMARLREEVLQHTSNNHKITFKETQEMPYLQAVIKEALRLHPATGLPMWRVIPEGGAEVAGHWLPGGTNVGINSWVAHYDQSVYGEDVQFFKPERWLGVKENDDRLRAMEANYMPFGLGSRTCLGRHISMLEMCKLIPALVTTFDFELTMRPDQWTTKNYWFVKPENFPVKVTRSFLTSEPFCIKGPNGNSFYVHANLLAKNSSVLDKAINSNMREAKEHLITIEDIDGDLDDDTIVRFVEYIYTGDYSVCTSEEVVRRPVLGKKEVLSNSADTGASATVPESVDTDTTSPLQPTGGLLGASTPFPLDFPYSTPAQRAIDPAFRFSAAPVWSNTARYPPPPVSFVNGTYGLSADQPAVANTWGNPATPGLSKRHQLWTDFTSQARVEHKKGWEPRKSGGPSDDYALDLLCHARLYVFTNRYECVSLSNLTLKKLRLTLSRFDPSQGVAAAIELVKYTYEHTQDYATGCDPLRSLVIDYTVCHLEKFVYEKAFKELMRLEYRLAADLVDKSVAWLE